jgi:TPR repeat protein
MEDFQILNVRFMKTISVSIFIVLAIASCATKQATISDARTLFKAGNYEQSVEILKELTKSGDAAAQFDLASLYVFGSHVPADQAMAEKLWGMSCRQEYYVACTNIGQRYLHYGKYEKAEAALLEAGNNGDRLAAQYLGELYGTQSWSGASEVKARYWNDEAEKRK